MCFILDYVFVRFFPSGFACACCFYEYTVFSFNVDGFRWWLGAPQRFQVVIEMDKIVCKLDLNLDWALLSFGSDNIRCLVQWPLNVNLIKKIQKNYAVSLVF